MEKTAVMLPSLVLFLIDSFFKVIFKLKVIRRDSRTILTKDCQFVSDFCTLSLGN